MSNVFPSTLLFPVFGKYIDSIVTRQVIDDCVHEDDTRRIHKFRHKGKNHFVDMLLEL